MVDVGTDHALLPISLVEAGQCTRAIASDIAAGPCAAARRNIADHGLTAAIDVRCGPGLSTVRPGEVDTVVIAGMGGATAVDILAGSPEVVAHCRRLVIQPMNGGNVLRSYLFQQGLWIAAERMIEEDGHIYDIVSVDNATAFGLASDTDDPAYAAFSPSTCARACAFEFGPLHLRAADAVVLTAVKAALERWQQILTQMNASADEAVIAKRKRLQQKMSWLQQWCTRIAPLQEGKDAHHETIGG